MRESRGILSAFGLLLGVAVVAAGHVAGGGDLHLFLQPTALLVVFGGTVAALIVSFPVGTLARAVRAAAGARSRHRARRRSVPRARARARICRAFARGDSTDARSGRPRGRGAL